MIFLSSPLFQILEGKRISYINLDAVEPEYISFRVELLMCESAPRIRALLDCVARNKFTYVCICMLLSLIHI